jgi:electron transport complex protein RnfG
MILCLGLISIAMSAALGVVYSITKDPIEQAQKQKEIQALKEVLPVFDNDPLENAKADGELTIYEATNQGQPAGYAVKTFTDKGFSGRFTLMVGFRADGSINNIVVLDQKETPGLGNKMKEPGFKDQFSNLNISTLKDKRIKVKKDGGTIDAITAATISSRAFCDAVQKAWDAYTGQGAGKPAGSPTDSLTTKGK